MHLRKGPQDLLDETLAHEARTAGQENDLVLGVEFHDSSSSSSSGGGGGGDGDVCVCLVRKEVVKEGMDSSAWKEKEDDKEVWLQVYIC